MPAAGGRGPHIRDLSPEGGWQPHHPGAATPAHRACPADLPDRDQNLRAARSPALPLPLPSPHHWPARLSLTPHNSCQDISAQAPALTPQSPRWVIPTPKPRPSALPRTGTPLPSRCGLSLSAEQRDRDGKGRSREPTWGRKLPRGRVSGQIICRTDRQAAPLPYGVSARQGRERLLPWALGPPWQEEQERQVPSGTGRPGDSHDGNLPFSTL